MTMKKTPVTELKLAWEKSLEGGPAKDYFETAKKVVPSFHKCIATYPDLTKLAKSMDLEEQIDFRRANEERRKAIDDLSRELPKRDLEKLVLTSIQFKMGKCTQSEFHSFLWDLIEEYQLDKEEYPNLQSFAAYITCFESIDRSDLVEKLTCLHEDLLKEL